METGKAIYRLLKDSTDVGAICADRIYPELAQQDADAPFIVYTVTDTTPSATKNATSKLDTARVELYCVSNDYETGMDLGIAVRSALDRVSGTVSGVEVQSIDFDTSDIQFDPDQRVYVLEQTYDVRIQRTGTAVSIAQFPGNTFTVEEVDGSPTGAVNKLVVSNNSLTISGTTATIDTGGGVTSVNSLTGIVTLYADNLFMESGSAQTIYGKFQSVDGNITDILDILKGTAGTELGVFSDPDDNTQPSLKVTATSALLRGGTGTVISAEQTSPGTLTFAVAAGVSDTETTALTIAGQANGNTITTLQNEVRMSGTLIGFSNASGTVTFSGATSGISYNDLDDLPASVGVTYHNRYSTQAESERSGATATLEIYYTARPDGDGYAESEVSDVGETDTINRTLYYSTKFQADPDTAGDWTEYTTQPADNATFATAKAALLAGLNETDATAETRGTLPLSLKMVRTTSAAATDLLLDTYPGAAAAYSVRKLDKDYTGYCMKVREDSGDTEADIGFDGSGNLDTAAIATHCGIANGYVVTWYDQSGNSRNATQSTGTIQPQIYDGSNVYTVNNKPALTLKDNTTAGGGFQVSGISQSQPYTICTVAMVQAGTSNNTYAWSALPLLSLNNTSGSGTVLCVGGGNTTITTVLDSTQDVQGLYMIAADSSNLELYARTSVGEASSTTGSTVSSYAPNYVMGRRIQDVSNWTMQDLIIWDSDQLTSNKADIRNAINSYYSIYT
jgi:hypothetical protein